MYLHFKDGFIEADRWDGQLTPDATVNRSLMRALALSGELGLMGRVVVARAREALPLRAMVAAIGVADEVDVLRSPDGWDYEWRAFLPAEHFAEFMSSVALDLDYRNFKNYCGDWAPAQKPLAYAVWDAAHRSVRR